MFSSTRNVANEIAKCGYSEEPFGFVLLGSTGWIYERRFIVFLTVNLYDYTQQAIYEKRGTIFFRTSVKAAAKSQRREFVIFHYHCLRFERDFPSEF